MKLLLANKADINVANKVQSLKYLHTYDRCATNCKINAILRIHFIYDVSAYNHSHLFKIRFCMQDGCTPAYRASEKGRTEILALLLANKADLNAASKV